MYIVHLALKMLNAGVYARYKSVSGFIHQAAMYALVTSVLPPGESV